jgi:hypothetical protein
MERQPTIFRDVIDQEKAKELPNSNAEKRIRERYKAAYLLKDADAEKLLIIKVHELLRMAKEDKIIGYDQNRGSGKPSRTTVASVTQNLNMNGLGQLSVGVFGEDWETNRNPEIEARLAAYGYGKILVNTDFHGRLYGLLNRFNAGLMTEEELNDVISVRIIPPGEFLLAYQTTNSGQKHTVNHGFANRDLGFGNKLSEVFSGLPPEIVEFIDKGKNAPILTDILLGLHLEETQGKELASFADIYGLRLKASKLSNRLKEELKLKISPTRIKDYQEAIKHWYDYWQEVEDMEKQHGMNHIRYLRATGWMGAIISDHLLNAKKGRMLFHKLPKNLAQASYKHAADIKDSLPNLTRVRVGRIDKTMGDIDAVLRGRKVAR